jgi:soluble cytochrome b562
MVEARIAANELYESIDKFKEGKGSPEDGLAEYRNTLNEIIRDIDEIKRNGWATSGFMDEAAMKVALQGLEERRIKYERIVKSTEEHVESENAIAEAAANAWRKIGDAFTIRALYTFIDYVCSFNREGLHR